LDQANHFQFQFGAVREYHNNQHTHIHTQQSSNNNNMPKARLHSSKKQEIIDLQDSDDDEYDTVAIMKKSFVASGPMDRMFIHSESPPKQSSYKQQRQRSYQSPTEIVDLLDTKPAARKTPEGGLDQKLSPLKRCRTFPFTSRKSSSRISSDDVEIIENFVVVVGKPEAAAPVAALPRPLKISHSKEISPLMKVLEVFPDVAVDHLKKLLTENKGNPESVVALLADENYPKEHPSTAGAGTGKTDTAGIPQLHRSSSVVVERLRTEPKYDYSSPNAFQPTADYAEEALQQLVYDFPFLKIPAIRSILQNNHCKYTLARRHIHDVIVGKVERLKVFRWEKLPMAKNKEPAVPADVQKPIDEKDENQHYQVLKATLIRGMVSDASRQRLGKKVCVCRARKTIGRARPTISDEILRDEVHHFEEELQEWMDKIQKRLRCTAARKLSLENGSSVLCECCYEDAAASECVPCKDNGVSAELLTWYFGSF
jgi:hypothetical protein